MAKIWCGFSPDVLILLVHQVRGRTTPVRLFRWTLSSTYRLHKACTLSPVHSFIVKTKKHSVTLIVFVIFTVTSLYTFLIRLDKINQ